MLIPMPHKNFMLASAGYVFGGTVLGFVIGMYAGAMHPPYGIEKETPIVACMPEHRGEQNPQ
jgi:hypothetical protein